MIFRPGAALLVCTGLNCLALEIQFDYSYDTGGFFSGENVGRRAVLEAAAAVFESRITNPLGAIIPSGNNTWTLSFPHPSTGATVSLVNPVLPADTIVIYVGARQLSGSLIAYAEYNYSWSGSSQWVALWQQRDGPTSFASIGGAIAFSPNVNWHFDDDPLTLEPFSDYDFYTLAVHEIGHLLGFTYGANAFRSKVVNSAFTGITASALYGGPIPLGAGLDHFHNSVLFRGNPVNMKPFFSAGVRVPFTELDFAVLRDIGYTISPPTPASFVSIERNGDSVTLAWRGGMGPFVIEATAELGSPAWAPVTSPLVNSAATLEIDQPNLFFRLVDLGL